MRSHNLPPRPQSCHALAFEHRVKQGDGERVLTFVNETFEQLAREQGFYSEALMQELRHDKIRVSYVLPGSVATGFSGRPPVQGAEWKLSPEDVAQAIEDLLAHPARSLPSLVEIRPSRPPAR